MLPKLKRLNLKTDFKWVSSGQKIDTKYMRLFIQKGDNLNPRVGIAASSKSFKKAVDRNRAKRVVSAAFESLYLRLPATINIIALPKAGINKVKSPDVLSDLEEKLKSEKIVN